MLEKSSGKNFTVILKAQVSYTGFEDNQRKLLIGKNQNIQSIMRILD
jgi:hypothetical protein